MGMVLTHHGSSHHEEAPDVIIDARGGGVWGTAGVHVRVDSPPAGKTNANVKQAPHSFLLLVADDFTYHEGMTDATLTSSS